MMKAKIALCMVLSVTWCAAAPAAPVNVEGGLIVCVGAEALESVSGDWSKPGCVIQCLETSADKVAALRKKVRAAGCYGKVSVAQFDGQHLPYINNLVSMVVVGPGSRVPNSEVQRVLAPYGVAIAGGKKTTKPYPKDMDEWPQYLHGADNNCVAQDTVVGPPRHVQWISGPAWTRAHIGAATIASMVSAGGRLFTIEDRETAENPLLPARWKLIARGAFNGVELWTMDFPDWEQVTVYIKNFHSQMKRRLVATADVVYCTPGIRAPLTALDAATGKPIRTYKGTADTQEFVLHDGRLYAVVGDRMHFHSYRGAPGSSRARKPKKGGKKRGKAAGAAKPTAPAPAAKEGGNTFGGDGFPLKLYNPQTPNAETPTCVIVAIDARTGKQFWRSEDITYYTGCSMALKKGRLVYQTTQGVFCLNAKTGAKHWTARQQIPYGKGNRPNSLVLSDDAVYSEEGSVVRAYALADGSDYWGKTIKARKGYEAETDLLIAANALWMCGSCNNAKGIVLTKPVSFDLKTGDPIKTIPQVLSKPMGHDRCFRNFITKRFFINSKTGGPDCMDLISDAEYPAPFTRATCSMGHFPCNGLIYCGPWACQCHLPAGLHNFNAYYTNEASLRTKGQVVKVQRSVRLERGPAHGHSGKAADAPWPTYRQDPRRYAGAAKPVPAAGLQRVWRTRFKTPVTAPVIAEGKVFLAEKDIHTVRALDAATGKALWEYTAGGRIDSPPTYHKGLLLFGSRDGWVHCLRASDGALSWRFRDLPDKRICAFDQIESAWPVSGSVLIVNPSTGSGQATAYFCAGRSSYLDGGLFLYGLDPVSGKVRHQRNFYGPYAKDGFPAFVKEGGRSETEVILGTTADVMTSEGGKLYVRQQAFNMDLTDATPGKHLLASAGLLESKRQHREYALVKEDFNHRKQWTTEKTAYPTGDIIVSDGRDYYSVFGHPVNRGSSFNPRGGYLLMAKTRSQDTWTSRWTVKIPITGKAMALAGETVFLAGAPLVFDLDDPGAAYAGRKGGVLWAASTEDGSKLAQYKLDVLPAWDGIAAAYGKLFIVNQDGSIDCWGAGN